MKLRDQLRDNPYLGNGLLVALGALFVSSLLSSGGNPSLFLKALLNYLLLLTAAVAVVAGVVAIGTRLGSNASSAVVDQRKKPNKPGKKGKGKRKG
jgi:cation transporter-like permease